MKRKIYLLLSIVAVSLCFHISIKADVNDTSDTATNISEEETTFDYSKIDKNFKYREDWEDYYDISFCSNVTVSNSSYSYTGKEIKPVITVQVHDTKSSKINKILNKEYYTVEYKNNINPGKATAIIKGINGFYGKKTVTFKIKMPNIKIKLIKYKGKKIRIKTKKLDIKGIKYQIRYKKNTGTLIAHKVTKKLKYGVKMQYTAYTTTGKWKMKTYKQNNMQTKKLKKGNYFLQIRSYVKIDSKKYYGSWKAYNALINVGTKKANKNNYKSGSFISPNKFNKYYNKPGYSCNWAHAGRYEVNNVNFSTWSVYDYYNRNKCYLDVWADKYGNIIVN